MLKPRETSVLRWSDINLEGGFEDGKRKGASRVFNISAKPVRRLLLLC